MNESRIHFAIVCASFEWFVADFKSEGGVIKFINMYSRVKINNGATLAYLDYNW